MKLEYQIKKNDVGKTIDHILTFELNISARLLTKLIKNEKIFLNQKKCHTKTTAKMGDTLEVDFSILEDNSNILPTQMNLSILYEDEWFLVVDKPAGIPIHPSQSHYTDSLSNAIKYYFDSIGLSKKIRPVNRLDLNTSGLVLFAKCEYIQECFSKQMLQKIFQKEYLCFVDGIFPQRSGTINLPIARKEGSIIERCIDQKNGQPSVTHYEIMQEFKDTSLVKCFLETGRTHQIRVHMASMGHTLLR